MWKNKSIHTDSKEFSKGISEIVKRDFTDKINAIWNDEFVQSVIFNIENENIKKHLKDYGLTDDVTFKLKLSNSHYLMSYYKGKEVVASGYSSCSPSTLSVLRECVRQDTNNPDISLIGKENNDE